LLGGFIVACRKSLSILFLVVAALLLQACTAVQPERSTAAPAEEGAGAGQDGVAETEPAAAGSAELTKVRVLNLPYITFAPFFIAQEEGYFRNHGLDVEFVNMQQHQEVLPMLASGQVDVSSGVMGAGALNTIAQGGRIAIVADKGYIDPAGCPNYMMIASRRLLEEHPTPTGEQLRGRKALITQATWLEYFADKLLAAEGLTTADMESVYLPVTAQTEALNQGALELIVQSEPWISRFQEAGHMPILQTAEELLPGSQAAVVFYGARLLDENPEAGERFMAAYLEGVRQYNEGATDRNVEILAPHIQLEPDVLREMCWLPIRADGSINVESVLDFQAWALARGYMDTALDAEAFWEPRFIEAVAD
jgi:NitT/TauT family transport system substrate-binding protein